MEKNYYTNKFCESLELYLKMKMLKYVEYYLDTIPSDDRRNVDSIITRNQFTLEEINDLLIDYSPVEFDDSDLFSMAYRYFNNIVPSYRKNGTLVTLPDSIEKRLKSNDYPDIPDFLYLPIIYYLIWSSNPYQRLTQELLGNNLQYFEDNMPTHEEDLQYAHGDVFDMLASLDAITTDSGYIITEDDYRLLNQLLQYSSIFRHEKSVIENILTLADVTLEDVDKKIKVFSHFLPMDTNIEKNNNLYLYVKEMFDSVDNPDITPELVLLLQTDYAQKFYHIPQLEYLYKDKSVFTFAQILSFIHKFDETGEVIPEEDLQKLLNKRLDSSLRLKVPRELSMKIYSIYHEYRRKQFEFSFKDFSSYINSLGFDFSPYKYNGTKDFDFYMFELFCQHTIHSNYPPYCEELMKTASGKALLEKYVIRAKNKLQEEETNFSTDTYERLMPYAKQLVGLSDYTLKSFLIEFVPEEDQKRVAALCTWLNNTNPDFFNDSLFSSERYAADYKRLLRKKDLYFEQGSLKDLATDKVNAYWKLLKESFPYPKDRTLTRNQFFSQYREVYQKRINDISLDEVKNMSLFMQARKSILCYVDQTDYLPEQALEIIDSAISKMPSEKDLLLVMRRQLSEEIRLRDIQEVSFSEARKYINDVKDANKLLLLFFNSDFSSMDDFYQVAKEKFHISLKRQRDLIKTFLESDLDEEASILTLYQERRESINLRHREQLRDSAKQKAKEKLEENIDLYGEKALDIMKKFVASDESTIGKFCQSADISMNDFKFYRRLCVNMDSDVSVRVDQKAASIRRKFIRAMAIASNHIYKEMVRCHKEKVPYDIVKHYQHYGYSPRFIADIASKIGRTKEADNINKYLTLYPDIFVPINANKLEDMRRVSRIYPGNIYFGENKVSYNTKKLDYATKELDSMGVPITKGSLYCFLSSNSEKKETGYQKIKTEKKST